MFNSRSKVDDVGTFWWRTHCEKVCCGALPPDNLGEVIAAATVETLAGSETLFEARANEALGELKTGAPEALAADGTGAPEALGPLKTGAADGTGAPEALGPLKTGAADGTGAAEPLGPLKTGAADIFFLDKYLNKIFLLEISLINNTLKITKKANSIPLDSFNTSLKELIAKPIDKIEAVMKLSWKSIQKIPDKTSFIIFKCPTDLNLIQFKGKRGDLIQI
ncbi:hypothetical protein BpHYR1_028915 [Brachionus plicatilis]|uniref:Uncharacterized protein n=1 Tax=Brachionus plicatilis TaxID=10195 RepID=A0A3M7PSK1_BRAPC|nr:hypothetical protein BpHYR1_028915 [Brachionus plicatilis]